MKLKSKKDSGYDPTCKIWLTRDDGKGVCVGRAFSIIFCVLTLFCILTHAYRSQLFAVLLKFERSLDNYFLHNNNNNYYCYYATSSIFYFVVCVI